MEDDEEEGKRAHLPAHPGLRRRDGTSYGVTNNARGNLRIWSPAVLVYCKLLCKFARLYEVHVRLPKNQLMLMEVATMGLLDMFIQSLAENIKSFLGDLGTNYWVEILSTRLPIAYRKFA